MIGCWSRERSPQEQRSAGGSDDSADQRDGVEAPCGQEEIRIRKDVVEDAVIVTKKVRRKEVEVDDQTTGRMS